jgi:hypothetical protein
MIYVVVDIEQEATPIVYGVFYSREEAEEFGATVLSVFYVVVDISDPADVGWDL